MTGTMTSLTLTEEEKDLMQEILEERHRTLLLEISHTDHHHFKVVLRKKAEMLESLLNRFLAAASEITRCSRHSLPFLSF